MGLKPEEKKSLLEIIVVEEELPLKRIPAIIGGQKPDEASSLYRVSDLVSITDTGLRDAKKIVDKMTKVIKRYREITETGRALAANQIGINKQIVIFLHPDGDIISYLNPKITWKSKDKNIYWEMCMSGAPLGVDVERPSSIKAQWYDLEGKGHHELLEGFDARRMLHEIDHLHGKVCYNTKGTKYETLGYGLKKEFYLNQKLR